MFLKYEALGFIERVPPEEIKPPWPVYYMPHRAIVTQNSSSPIRPVFDASAKSQTGKSLNEALMAGPNLLPDLVSILMRFRRWPIALSGDIRMAFLNLYVHEYDRDFHRFLLYIDNKITIYRFNRLPFGNASSPFILNATLKYHVNLFPPSRATAELNSNIYVDNLITGVDTVEEAEILYRETCYILQSANLPLDKWNSNTSLLNNIFKSQNVSSVSCKYLGVEWDSHKDVITFSLILPEYNKFTKRTLLSLVSSIFDPLGIISPFTLMGKMLFQRVWCLGPQQGWDDPLPLELTEIFQNWLATSHELKGFKINRVYFPQPWKTSVKNLEVICFGDACPSGYGAVCYLRTRAADGRYLVAFCTSKTRVAPIKKMTLPRLELLSSLLVARLVYFVKTSLMIPEAATTCYTDSSITLHWIKKGDPSNLKLFISNEVFASFKKHSNVLILSV